MSTQQQADEACRSLSGLYHILSDKAQAGGVGEVGIDGNDRDPCFMEGGQRIGDGCVLDGANDCTGDSPLAQAEQALGLFGG